MAKYSATQGFTHIAATYSGGGEIIYPDSDTLAQLAKRITMAHTLPSMDKKRLHQNIYVRKGKRHVGMYHLIDNKLKLQRKMGIDSLEEKRRAASYKAMNAVKKEIG